MPIVYKLDPHGGFTCGDSVTGFTSYAYPTSPHATRARRYPKQVAEEMMNGEVRGAVERPWEAEYDARNWRHIGIRPLADDPLVLDRPVVNLGVN